MFRECIVLLPTNAMTEEYNSTINGSCRLSNGEMVVSCPILLARFQSNPAQTK